MQAESCQAFECCCLQEFRNAYRPLGGGAPGGAAAGGGLAAGGGVAGRAGMAGAFHPSSRSRCSRSSGPQGHRSRYLHISSPGLRPMLALAFLDREEDGQRFGYTHANRHHKGRPRSAWHCQQRQSARAGPVLLESDIEEVARGQVWQGVPPPLLQGCHLAKASQIILHLRSSTPPFSLTADREDSIGTCNATEP